MDVFKMIAELRAEKEAVEQSLLLLERIASGQGKRRGRPPKYLAALSAEPKTRKPFSEATKRKMAASQRRRWAEARKTEGEA